MDYSRQREIFEPDKFNLPVHVIGCGATGSWAAVMLAKLGVKELHLHDFDTVEEHNIPNQLFWAYTDIPYENGGKEGQIGLKKVTACRDQVFWTAGIRAEEHDGRVTGDTLLSGIVFVLTDTMASRAEIFNKALKNNVQVPLVIETRMSTEGGRVYAFNPSSRPQNVAYAKTLYTDEESMVSVCGIAQTLAPTAALMASLAVWQMIKFHNGDEIDNEILFDARNNTYLTRKF
jgi:molybdopterin/thiamine biosynthesis adenylyltransferase